MREVAEAASVRQDQLTALQDELSTLRQEVVTARDNESQAKTQIEALNQKYEDTFDDLRDHEYHLHAVICHGGSTGASGHYWVWIFDFEQRVWYNYNDRTVRVHKDNEKVLKDLSASDQPYYIAYVRRDNLELITDSKRINNSTI